MMIVSDACTVNVITDASRSANDTSRGVIYDCKSDSPNCGITFTIIMTIVICLQYIPLNGILLNNTQQNVFF